MSHSDDVRKLCTELGEQQLGAGTAVSRVVTRLGADAELGAARRKQLTEFGKRRGSDRHDAAEEEHKPWIREAQRLWRINRHLSISETARKVRKNLNLIAGLTTIRDAIRESRPPQLRS
jgi:hypothetical protein